VRSLGFAKDKQAWWSLINKSEREKLLGLVPSLLGYNE